MGCAGGWLQRLVERAHTNLIESPDAEHARQYLRFRNVPDHEWATFRLGFSGPIEVEECSQRFVGWMRRYWEHRLVFPLQAPTGEWIGMQTRSLEEKQYQMYYEYPTEVYPAMFGIQQAMPELWRTRQVAIVEGVFDLFAVRPFVSNVVAVMTAAVPATCRRFFRRYVAQLTVLLDMDDAGRQGVQKLFAGGLPCRILVPTYSAHDPGDLLKAPGGAAQIRRMTAHLGDSL